MLSSIINLSHVNEPVLDVGDNAFLRPLKPQDVTQNYIDSLNTPIVKEFLSTQDGHQYTESNVNQFVYENDIASDGILFGFFVNQQHCGNCRLHDITLNSSWLGLAIFETSIWGQGWGKKIITAVSQYTLQELKIPEIKATIISNNFRSKRAFIKSGYSILTAEQIVVNHGTIIEVWRNTL